MVRAEFRLAAQSECLVRPDPGPAMDENEQPARPPASLLHRASSDS
jgi:hypothetical protein